MKYGLIITTYAKNDFFSTKKIKEIDLINNNEIRSILELKNYCQNSKLKYATEVIHLKNINQFLFLIESKTNMNNTYLRFLLFLHSLSQYMHTVFVLEPKSKYDIEPLIKKLQKEYNKLNKKQIVKAVFEGVNEVEMLKKTHKEKYRSKIVWFIRQALNKELKNN